MGVDNKKIEGIDELSPQKQNDFLQVGVQLIVPTLKVKNEFIKMDDENNKKN